MSDRPVSADAAPARVQGTVLAVQANFYHVRLDAGETLPRRHLLCTRRTRLKKIGQRVMVGDRVIVEEPDWDGDRGAISEVLPRRTELDRPPVANADCLLLLFALNEPRLDPCQLSRFLVKAESTALSVQLCLNKCDVSPNDDRRDWRDRLREWGYEPQFLSARTGEGFDALQERLRDRITILAGPSGVGKSSTINRLIPAANLRVAEVSGKLGRGRHTTRHVELFQLPSGGLLADTPGFNQPEFSGTPGELAQCFPEIRAALRQNRCHFSDCLHREEPGCAVGDDWDRYNYYLTFLDEAIAREEQRQQSSDPESALKVKTGQHGRENYEPKLASKKYRRTSRRQQHQNLQDLYENLDPDDLEQALDDV